MSDQDEEMRGFVVAIPEAMLPKAKPVAPRLELTPKRSTGCFHMSVEVDEKKRFVTCVDCGANLNPMTVLDRLAREESRLSQLIESARVQSEALELRSRVQCPQCRHQFNVQPTISAVRQIEAERRARGEHVPMRDP